MAGKRPFLKFGCRAGRPPEGDTPEGQGPFPELTGPPGEGKSSVLVAVPASPGTVGTPPKADSEEGKAGILPKTDLPEIPIVENIVQVQPAGRRCDTRGGAVAFHEHLGNGVRRQLSLTDAQEGSHHNAHHIL